MASLQATAERRAKAIIRLEEAKTRLAELLGVEFEEQPITNRDIALAQVQQVENSATLIETVNAKLSPRVETEAVTDEVEAIESGVESDVEADEAEADEEEPTGLDSLGDAVCTSLIEAGYDTPEKVAAATDKELESLPRIGKATVKKIRELLAE